MAKAHARPQHAAAAAAAAAVSNNTNSGSPQHSYEDEDDDDDGEHGMSSSSHSWHGELHKEAHDTAGTGPAAAAQGHHQQQQQQMAAQQQRPRGKRRSAYTEEERRNRRRLANRESARRMRAKRSEAVQELEGSLQRMKERNKTLQRQNWEYARTVQALRAEVSHLQGCLVSPSADGGAGGSNGATATATTHTNTGSGNTGVQQPSSSGLLLQQRLSRHPAGAHTAPSAAGGGDSAACLSAQHQQLALMQEQLALLNHAPHPAPAAGDPAHWHSAPLPPAAWLPNGSQPRPLPAAAGLSVPLPGLEAAGTLWLRHQPQQHPDTVPVLFAAGSGAAHAGPASTDGAAGGSNLQALERLAAHGQMAAAAAAAAAHTDDAGAGGEEAPLVLGCDTSGLTSEAEALLQELLQQPGAAAGAARTDAAQQSSLAPPAGFKPWAGAAAAGPQGGGGQQPLAPQRTAAQHIDPFALYMQQHAAGAAHELGHPHGLQDLAALPGGGADVLLDAVVPCAAATGSNSRSSRSRSSGAVVAAAAAAAAAAAGGGGSGTHCSSGGRLPHTPHHHEQLRLHPYAATAAQHHQHHQLQRHEAAAVLADGSAAPPAGDAHAAAGGDGNSSRPSKRRFPLKRPSRLLQHATPGAHAASAAMAATSAAAGEGWGAAAPAAAAPAALVRLNSITSPAGALGSPQLLQQHDCVMMQAPAPAGSFAARVHSSCSSRVGGAPAAPAASPQRQWQWPGSAASPTGDARLPAHGAPAVDPLAQQRTLQPAMSMPWDHAGLAAVMPAATDSFSGAADGCRSYASDPAPERQASAADGGGAVDSAAAAHDRGAGAAAGAPGIAWPGAGAGAGAGAALEQELGLHALGAADAALMLDVLMGSPQRGEQPQQLQPPQLAADGDGAACFASGHSVVGVDATLAGVLQGAGAGARADAAAAAGAGEPGGALPLWEGWQEDQREWMAEIMLAAGQEQ